ncbi:MAG: cytochrome c, partial [Bdellovibrio sp.]
DPKLQSSALAILDKNCSSCHTQSSGPMNVYGLNDVNHLFSSGLLVAGDPSKSSLFTAIQSGTMPPAGPLSAADQDVIKNFIIAAASVATTPTTPSTPSTPTPIATIDPNLQSAALNIFSTNCSSCHTQTSGPAGVYGLTDINHLFSSGLLVAGDPTTSLAFTAIQAGTMPPSGPLSAADQDIIRNFIMAAGNGNSQVPSPPTPEPTFTYIEKYILGPNCAGCHYQGSARGGYAFDSYTSTLRAVNKSSPTRSILVSITQQGEMPPQPRTVLSSDQVNLIITWIQNGALNN